MKTATPATIVTSHARQAIVTRCLGPTNTLGARIVATAEAGRIVVPWDHACGVFDNHAAAARAFADRFGWGGRWVGGGTRDAYVFTMLVD